MTMRVRGVHEECAVAQAEPGGARGRHWQEQARFPTQRARWRSTRDTGRVVRTPSFGCEPMRGRGRCHGTGVDWASSPSTIMLAKYANFSMPILCAFAGSILCTAHTN